MQTWTIAITHAFLSCLNFMRQLIANSKLILLSSLFPVSFGASNKCYYRNSSRIILIIIIRLILYSALRSWLPTWCLEKYWKRHNFVLENYAKLQSHSCTNPVSGTCTRQSCSAVGKVAVGLVKSNGRQANDWPISSPNSIEVAPQLLTKKTYEIAPK